MESSIGQCGMDLLTAIETRRSIRKYTQEPVTEEQLATILHACFCAPSAHNKQPWELIVVRDPAQRKRFADFGKYQKMVESAPLAIVVCGNTEKMHHHDLLMHDCAGGVENMLLAAHGLGLGAVWCGVVQEEMIDYFREQLSIPAHVLPMALIAIGHPAEERPAPERYLPHQVHSEKFGNQA